MGKAKREYRCPSCNKLLFVASLRDGVVETVCPRCGRYVKRSGAPRENRS